MATVAVWSGAVADPKPDAHAEAEKHYAAGKVHFNVRAYPDAIAEFKVAYATDPDPVYLFNIAQAYRLMGDCIQADAFYANFAAAEPDPQRRAVGEEQRANIAGCVRTQKAAAEAARQAKVKAEADRALAEAAARRVEAENAAAAAAARRAAAESEAARQRAELQARSDDTDRIGRGKRRLGYALVLGGTVSLATGAVFSWLGHAARSDLDALCNGDTPDLCTEEAVIALDDRGHRRNVYAWIGYSAGAALAIGGATMYVLGRREREHAIRVGFGSGGATLAITGRF